MLAGFSILRDDAVTASHFHEPVYNCLWHIRRRRNVLEYHVVVRGVLRTRDIATFLPIIRRSGNVINSDRTKTDRLQLRHEREFFLRIHSFLSFLILFAELRYERQVQ